MSLVLPQTFLSEIDKKRFGIITARTVGVTVEGLSSLIEFCKEKEVKLLIARCSIADHLVAQTMEREGFLLMDTLVYYTVNLTKRPIPEISCTAQVRPIILGEEKEVRLIASKAFRNYFGHYHADQRLDRNKCNEVYADWAFNACASKGADKNFLVAELDGKIVGFALLRINNPDEGEWVLGGVHPDFHGKRIYQSILCSVMGWFLSKEVKKITISTQLTNLAVQRVWARFGFEIERGCYTFHKWFD